MMERIVDLGAGMFGILAEPEPAASAPYCFVLINAGNLHRCGPFRLHVKLVRRLARQGLAALRFDVPGVGDSLRRSDKPQREALRDMLDQLEAVSGHSRFVVAGICAGADSAWQLALDDERVVGVTLLDGLARKGPCFAIGRTRRALRKSPAAWLATFARVFAGRGGPATLATPEDLRDWPARGVERDQLARLLDRGVEVFFLYTGGTSYFLHPGQFAETYGAAAGSPSVRFLHWPDCDHLFYLQSDRERLIEEISGWLGQRLVPPPQQDADDNGKR